LEEVLCNRMVDHKSKNFFKGRGRKPAALVFFPAAGIPPAP
jgi:hypothetical protein